MLMRDDSVFLMRAKNYREKTMREAAERIVAYFGGAEAMLKKGKKVLIKVNLIIGRHPDGATTTHPALVGAIASILIHAGAEVVIADSPGGPYKKELLRRIYTETGMVEAASHSGAFLNYDCTHKRMMYEGARKYAFDIIKPVWDANVIINIAKLKNHGMMYFTGAVKNMFGVIPGLEKPAWHAKCPDKKVFGEMLADLCECVAPDYSIIDGITGMDGKGPSGGRVRNPGILIAGRNPHALDFYAMHFIGLDWKKVPTLMYAVKSGLVPGHLAGLRLTGDPVTPMRVPFVPPIRNAPSGTIYQFLPESIRNLLMRFLVPYPKIKKRMCIGCGNCATACPKKAIAVVHEKACVNRDLCIKCYCCHEMCPVKAIRL